MTPVQEFVARLAAVSLPPHLGNPYAFGVEAGNSLRRANLTRYLDEMQARETAVLLLGEAPGYLGCCLTGIPFTSPYNLQAGFPGPGYETNAEWHTVRREPTATIVRETLAGAEVWPLLWNALPFHPHRPGEPASNRTPSRQELDCGRPFLLDLLDLFPIRTLIAVGRQADRALTAWDISAEGGHETVRHPSHGGKQAFQQGLWAILQAHDRRR
ncbi:MAG: hypothetical protein H6659_00555 [Ardenticatenaceae bacterium]|nr:hypothetical protein [Ardenticatenaceae bacterium]